jgi:hypothetical protein
MVFGLLAGICRKGDSRDFRAVVVAHDGSTLLVEFRGVADPSGVIRREVVLEFVHVSDRASERFEGFLIFDHTKSSMEAMVVGASSLSQLSDKIGKLTSTAGASAE